MATCRPIPREAPTTRATCCGDVIVKYLPRYVSLLAVLKKRFVRTFDVRFMTPRLLLFKYKGVSHPLSTRMAVEPVRIGLESATKGIQVAIRREMYHPEDPSKTFICSFARSVYARYGLTVRTLSMPYSFRQNSLTRTRLQSGILFDGYFRF